MAPPETPAVRVATLREALTATFADSQLRAEAAKQRLDIAPVSGDEIASVIRAAYAAPPETLRRYEELSKPPAQFETAKPVVVRAPLLSVENGGQRIGFESAGKPSRAVVASETEVTIGGSRADAVALKPGMVCVVTYFGDRGQAKFVVCD
jgi:hypothetical protein